MLTLYDICNKLVQSSWFCPYSFLEFICIKVIWKYYRSGTVWLNFLFSFQRMMLLNWKFIPANSSNQHLQIISEKKILRYWTLILFLFYVFVLFCFIFILQSREYYLAFQVVSGYILNEYLISIFLKGTLIHSTGICCYWGKQIFT